MPASPPTHPRDRMLASAVELLSERGEAGVTLDEVLARSGAPRGSVYHHFPGGRAELLDEAVRLAGAVISDRMRYAVETGRDAMEVLTKIVTFRKRILEQSEFTAGCPVAAAVGTNPETSASAQEAFLAWEALVTSILVSDGVQPQRAKRLASVCVASIEGAIITSRASRSTKPLDNVLAELAVLVESVVPTGS